MKTLMTVFALLLSLSTHAAATAPDAICWMAANDEADCTGDTALLAQQSDINAVYGCSSQDQSTCYQFLVQRAEDCKDTGDNSIDECAIW